MKAKIATRIEAVEEYYFSKKLREIATLKKQGKTIINLGIGSPDLPPAHSVINALKEASQLSHANGYQSYKGTPALRNAFSQWYQKYFQVSLNPDTEILPLMGSKEGIMHIAMTFLNPGDQVLVPDPGYPAYAATAKLADAKVVKYALNADLNWLPNLEALAQQDLSKVKIMWLNYPHMPTGAQASTEAFKTLIKFARENKILLCHDNPYAFILNENPSSILSIPGASDVCIELNSLSKSHCMAGWRIGMIAADEYYIQQILKFKSNMDSGMYLPIQLAAIEALKLPSAWYDKMNLIYAKRKQKALALLDMLELEYSPNQSGMFVWAKLNQNHTSAYALSDQLLYQAGVFLTPGGIFGKQGENYIRVSLCNSIETLEQATQNIKNQYTWSSL